MIMVNVHEAKTQLSKLLVRAHAGEEITIGKAGKAYARLVPISNQGPRPLGLLSRQGKIGKSFFEPLPQAELRRWEGKP